MARGATRVLAGFIGVFFAFLLVARPASAASPLAFSAKLNGHDIASLTSNDPLKLSPSKPLDVSLRVMNASSAAITVESARVRGKVMGLTFFSFVATVHLVVPANGTASTQFQIGLADLGGQAIGLLPTSLDLLNTNGGEIAHKGLTVDVRGDITSIYGVFGLAVAAVTLLWLVSLVVRVARRSLPGNRWSRAIQFAVAGFGVGLTLTFTVSALRLLTPDASVWAPFVFGAGLVGFVVGYLTPGPRVVDADEEEDFIAEQRRREELAGVGARQRPALEQQRAGQLEQQRAGQLEQQHAGQLPASPPGELGAATDNRNDVTRPVDRSAIDAFFNDTNEQRPGPAPHG